MRWVSWRTSSPLMIGTHAPRNERRQFGEESDQRDGLPRGLGNIGQFLHAALDQGSGRHHVAANDDHHHLHGEGDQRPKAFAALDGQVEGLFAGGNSDQEDDNDSDQREHQRIGKPAFAPIGKRDADARQAASLSSSFAARPLDDIKAVSHADEDIGDG